MMCKLFNCDKRHGNICCRECRDRRNCANPCLNSPDKCRQATEDKPGRKLRKGVSKDVR